MGAENRPAGPDDIARMRDELVRSLEEGSFGLSTGLVYPPGCFASRNEIAEVARAAEPYDALYATHMRSEGEHIEDAIDEAVHVAQTAGLRLEISHLKLSGRPSWGKIDWLDEHLHGRIDDGVDLTADRYTYIASSTDLGVIVPQWVQEGTPEQRMARAADPETRRRIEREVLEQHPEPDYWDKIVLSSVPEGEDPEYNGKSLREVGELQNRRPIDTVLDFLAQHKTKPSAVFFSMCEENLRRVLAWPFVGVGSDARAQVPRGDALRDRPHPRAYGTFSRFLGRYVRDEGLIPLEEAVRKITSQPASRLGLPDRGTLRPGAAADIAVFDPAAVADRATFAEPHQTSVGFRWVLVNGEPVIENDRHTDARPGRALRRS
jgi:N-acyl-D-amino-acid deacylase